MAASLAKLGAALAPEPTEMLSRSSHQPAATSPHECKTRKSSLSQQKTKKLSVEILMELENHQLMLKPIGAD